jgi:hypothetical protein
MIHLENRWTDLDEIWCGLYVIGMYYGMVYVCWRVRSPNGEQQPQTTTPRLNGQDRNPREMVAPEGSCLPCLKVYLKHHERDSLKVRAAGRFGRRTSLR